MTTPVGIDHIIGRVEANYENIQIRVLCSIDGNDSLVQLWKELSPLESMLNGYVILAEVHASDIFVQAWQKKIRDLQHAGDTLSLTDVQTKLWDPVVEKCIELLTTLQKCTMTLSVVDEYFCQYQHKKGAALTSMVNLFYGLKEYMTSLEGSEEEIQAGLDLIEQYWSLCTYAKAAKVCLHLKSRLELQGDFQIVEMLAKQVSSLHNCMKEYIILFMQTI